jgi:hypothetical protein
MIPRAGFVEVLPGAGRYPILESRLHPALSKTERKRVCLRQATQPKPHRNRCDRDGTALNGSAVMRDQRPQPALFGDAAFAGAAIRQPRPGSGFGAAGSRRFARRRGSSRRPRSISRDA